jgi:hypothetical protein
MTVSNTTTQETYAGNGVNTDFTIPFDFTDTDTIVAYLIDNTETENLLTEGVDYTLTGGPPVTTVAYTVPPAADEYAKIKRISPRTQATNYSGTTFPAETVEEDFDNLVRLVQENRTEIDAITGGSSTTTVVGTLPDWVVDEDYTADQIVLYSDKIYRCVTDHTSVSFETDYGNGLWELVQTSGTKGDTGDQGEKGDTGATGATGAAGANGAAGADGVFAEIASQAEAQAGTNNTKGMTPLRTKNALDNYKSNEIDPETAALQTQITSNDVDISALDTRVTQLEAATSSSEIYVQRGIANNVAVAQELNGAEVDKDAAQVAIVEVHIRRQDDIEERVEQARFVMQYIGGLWYIEEIYTNRISGNPSGVTLSILTPQDGDVGKLAYISDALAGTLVADNNYIRLFIKKMKLIP